MSSRKNSKDSGGSSGSGEWSEWKWDGSGQRWWRALKITKREYEYEYDYETAGPVSTSSNVPRHEDANLATIPETDPQYTSQNNYITNPINEVTEQLDRTSLTSELNVPQPQANVTGSRSHVKKEFAKEYQVHRQWEFKWGRVFKVLWSEPKGNGGEGGTVKTWREGRHGEKFFEKVRRFVIIDARQGHCICLPIMTYGGRATTKSGVHADDHAIIYTDRPILLEREVELAKHPIRVKPWSPEHILEPASRLNYAKVYTVEYNSKVWFIGEIHRDSEWWLTAAYNEVHPPLRPRGIPPPSIPGYPPTTSSPSLQYPSQYSNPYVPATFSASEQTPTTMSSAWQMTPSHQTSYPSNIATPSWGPEVTSSSYPTGGSSYQQPTYQGGGYDNHGGGGSSSYQTPPDPQDRGYERHDDIYDAN